MLDAVGERKGAVSAATDTKGAAFCDQDLDRSRDILSR